MNIADKQIELENILSVIAWTKKDMHHMFSMISGGEVGTGVGEWNSEQDVK